MTYRERERFINLGIPLNLKYRGILIATIRWRCNDYFVIMKREHMVKLGDGVSPAIVEGRFKTPSVEPCPSSMWTTDQRRASPAMP